MVLLIYLWRYLENMENTYPFFSKFVEFFLFFPSLYARSAVGVNSLPLGVPVEVEAIAEIINSFVRCSKDWQIDSYF